MPRSSSESTALPTGTLIGGKYRIDGAIGQGGMGAVYRATNTATGRRVALKWMLHPNPEMRERMKREALAMGSIEHPNVVQVLDAGEHEGAFFLVMELLRGKTLADHADERALPVEEALAILLPAMQGVEAAHAAGLVHRDLKPENFFLVLDERGAITSVKLLDFGIARPMGEGQRDGRSVRNITRSGAVVGTPRYMAPEQIQGTEIDARTDVYAIGVLAYELLTGAPPFEGPHYEALILAIMTDTPRPPHLLAPSVPTALSAVILRAIARNPAERFASVAELAHAFEPFTELRYVAPSRRVSNVSDHPPASHLEGPAEASPTKLERTTPQRKAAPPATTSETRRLGARVPAETPPEDPSVAADPGETPRVRGMDVASDATAGASSVPVASRPQPARMRAVFVLVAVVVLPLLLYAARQAMRESHADDLTPTPVAGAGGAEEAQASAVGPAPAAPFAARVPGSQEAAASDSPLPPPGPRAADTSSNAAVSSPRRTSASQAPAPTPERSAGATQGPEVPPTQAPGPRETPLEARGRAGVIRADDF